MLNLPSVVIAFLAPFAPLLTPSVWYHAQILLVGAILTPGQRPVTAILSVMGLRQSRHFQNYHRVLNRPRWSSRAISQRLLLALVQVFVPYGPIFLGLDATVERRRGKRSPPKAFTGIPYDQVTVLSSK
jgi:hypothetical protein